MWLILRSLYKITWFVSCRRCMIQSCRYRVAQLLGFHFLWYRMCRYGSRISHGCHCGGHHESRHGKHLWIFDRRSGRPPDSGVNRISVLRFISNISSVNLHPRISTHLFFSTMVYHRDVFLTGLSHRYFLFSRSSSRPPRRTCLGVTESARIHVHEIHWISSVSRIFPPPHRVIP